jgi:putative hydrolase of the HAD superfamily
MIRAPVVVLFDIDDTLVNHSVAFDEASAALHESCESDLSLAEFVAAWTAAHSRHFASYVAGTISYDDQRRARIRDVWGDALSDDEADERFAVYLHEYEASWRLFDDVLPCLDRLAAHQLGVISNGQSDQQRRKLSRLNILERFDFVLISEECDWAKPDVEIFSHAMSSMNRDAATAIYIGDRYELDAVPARAAGLCGVWLDRRRSAHDASRTPTIATLEELPELAARMRPNYTGTLERVK